MKIKRFQSPAGDVRLRTIMIVLRYSRMSFSPLQGMSVSRRCTPLRDGRNLVSVPCRGCPSPDIPHRQGLDRNLCFSPLQGMSVSRHLRSANLRSANCFSPLQGMSVSRRLLLEVQSAFRFSPLQGMSVSRRNNGLEHPTVSFSPLQGMSVSRLNPLIEKITISFSPLQGMSVSRRFVCNPLF